MSAMQNNLPTLHIVADSISMHYGPYLQTMLAGVMQYSRKAGNGVDTESANGGDSSLVLAYLNQLQTQSDYLMVNCGLHDLRRDVNTRAYQVPIEKYAENLHAIIARAHDIAPHLIWVRITPVVDEIHNRLSTSFHRHATDVDAYNGCADQIMREHHVPMIDLFTFTRNLGEGVYLDHVHYHDTIRAQHAAFIAGSLAQILKG
jgi:lysophospholipase L1-like esterase